jgi:alkaline phosphatase D
MDGPFRHGVASADPLTDRVILWTRVTTDAAEAPVEWVLARDAGLSDVVASGEAVARAEDDHTVTLDATGLEPDTAYHYAFTAAGERSPVARTRTLPADPERLRFATCSCAKFNAGFFNAYSRVAERGDLAFLLHLGDYIYEASQTPPANQTPGADIGRPFEPRDECRTLADYRTRYAQYHRDPDVQALHHALPIIATIDDHELADGAWAGGADNHREDEHGPWSERKANAFRARWEWVPGRRPDPADPTRVFRTVPIGSLAELMLLDIRSRRHQPVEGPEAEDPARSMLGAEQREFLFGALGASGAAWRFVCSPSIVSQTWCDAPGEPLKTALLKLKLMDSDGTGPDCDQWDGYPAERRALLARIAETGDANAVILSADIHTSVAAEVHVNSYGEAGSEPVAVELTAPSLTSQNLDDKLGYPRRSQNSLDAEAALIAALDHVRYCEMDSHGYVVVDVDRERVRGEWWHLDTVLERAPGESLGAAWEVRRGEPRLVDAGH